MEVPGFSGDVFLFPCHRGRKYQRLMFPNEVKKTVSRAVELRVPKLFIDSLGSCT